jgi:hypothetical protein
MHRLFFLNQNYIADSVLTLSYDRYLHPEIDQTTIYFGTDNRKHNLLDVYREFDISTNNMSVVLDPDIVNPYCSPLNIDIYCYGGWIAQQFLKFIALDKCDAECILIQDCDTFAIAPITFFKENLPVCLTVPETTPNSYDQYYSRLTNCNITGDFCFVSEFMPVLKADWIALRNRIEDVHQCHWIEAMHKEFAKDRSNQVWFSEYQLLGRWAMHQHPNLKTVVQHRLILTEQLKRLNAISSSKYNFACNNRCFSIADLKNNMLT